jgi:hypothetical protein
MQYLDELANITGIDSTNPYPAARLIQSNLVSNYLTSLGYSTVSFESGFGGTDLFSADEYFAPTYTLTPFQNELITITPFRILLRNYQYESQRKRINHTFDNLPSVIPSNQPKFVFAHINAPHPPFVFKPNGEANNPDMAYIATDGNSYTEISGQKVYVEQYRDQVIYLNQRIQEVINLILNTSGSNSIIIIQGDHGPGSRLKWNSREETNLQERMSIINAYYFPDLDYTQLYPGISPVNTFRIILDQYFGTDLGLLEDRSYFSLMEKPYEFMDVTEELNRP